MSPPASASSVQEGSSTRSNARHKIIHFTRHAQAYHNVAEDYTIRDAELTPKGKGQSKQLYHDTKDSFQTTAELIVSSPLRRPMETMLIGYASALERLSSTSPVILLPELQEVCDLLCDTGSERAELEADERFAHLDFSRLDSAPAEHGEKEHAWNSKQGFWSPERVKERGKWVRRWLRDRPEQEIIVVAHGDVLRAITHPNGPYEVWSNAQVKTYTFESDDDDEATVVLVESGPTEGGARPTGEEMLAQA
ncbi:BQ2448_7745 [Microbotryum intermedium]|uniref:BQ2448_7745 protein n=1 Tax=Microbotryum intermedium TaxID=269621 RepID=A0A238FUH0_9BASI|nr:BQ2448_7745 [Microbotryum intermedium]